MNLISFILRKEILHEDNGINAQSGYYFMKMIGNEDKLTRQLTPTENT